MKSGYLRPKLLERGHAVDDFVCKSIEQTAWLREHARQSHSAGSSKVFVVTEPDAPTVVAYYSWTMASIAVEDVPARMRNGGGRYPQPVALLARLGVDAAHEGRGLGAGLLQDVISRLAELGTTIGCRGLLVHAETEQARDFYLHLVGGFEASPSDSLHLVLLMKDIHHTLRGQ